MAVLYFGSIAVGSGAIDAYTQLKCKEVQIEK